MTGIRFQADADLRQAMTYASTVGLRTKLNFVV
jgi:hypothetical protein